MCRVFGNPEGRTTGLANLLYTQHWATGCNKAWKAPRSATCRGRTQTLGGLAKGAEGGDLLFRQVCVRQHVEVQGWVCTYMSELLRSQVGGCQWGDVTEIWTATLGRVPTALCGSIRSVLMTRDGSLFPAVCALLVGAA